MPELTIDKSLRTAKLPDSIKDQKKFFATLDKLFRDAKLDQKDFEELDKLGANFLKLATANDKYGDVYVINQGDKKLDEKDIFISAKAVDGKLVLKAEAFKDLKNVKEAFEVNQNAVKQVLTLAEQSISKDNFDAKYTVNKLGYPLILSRDFTEFIKDKAENSRSKAELDLINASLGKLLILTMDKSSVEEKAQDIAKELGFKGKVISRSSKELVAHYDQLLDSSLNNKARQLQEYPQNLLKALRPHVGKTIRKNFFDPIESLLKKYIDFLGSFYKLDFSKAIKEAEELEKLYEEALKATRLATTRHEIQAQDILAKFKSSLDAVKARLKNDAKFYGKFKAAKEITKASAEDKKSAVYKKFIELVAKTGGKAYWTPDAKKIEIHVRYLHHRPYRNSNLIELKVLREAQEESIKELLKLKDLGIKTIALDGFADIEGFKKRVITHDQEGLKKGLAVLRSRRFNPAYFNQVKKNVNNVSAQLALNSHKALMWSGDIDFTGFEDKEIDKKLDAILEDKTIDSKEREKRLDQYTEKREELYFDKQDEDMVHACFLGISHDLKPNAAKRGIAVIEITPACLKELAEVFSSDTKKK